MGAQRRRSITGADTRQSAHVFASYPLRRLSQYPLSASPVGLDRRMLGMLGRHGFSGSAGSTFLSEWRSGHPVMTVPQ
jgi:hypothetical protein